jgi:hypothetical protein
MENDVDKQVGEEHHPGILLNDDQALPEYIDQQRDNPTFPYTTEQKWTVALMKLLIDWNAPDEAFGMILKWARSAKADNYSFYPSLEGGHLVTKILMSCLTPLRMQNYFYLI